MMVNNGAANQFRTTRMLNWAVFETVIRDIWICDRKAISKNDQVKDVFLLGRLILINGILNVFH